MDQFWDESLTKVPDVTLQLPHSSQVLWERGILSVPCTMNEYLLCRKRSVSYTGGVRNAVSGQTQSPGILFSIAGCFAWPKYTVDVI